MSENQSRSPFTLTNSSVKYDEPLILRRKMITTVSIIAGVIFLFICFCMTCSLYSMLQDLLIRISTK